MQLNSPSTSSPFFLSRSHHLPHRRLASACGAFDGIDPFEEVFLKPLHKGVCQAVLKTGNLLSLKTFLSGCMKLIEWNTVQCGVL